MYCLFINIFCFFYKINNSTCYKRTSFHDIISRWNANVKGAARYIIKINVSPQSTRSQLYIARDAQRSIQNIGHSYNYVVVHRKNCYLIYLFNYREYIFFFIFPNIHYTVKEFLCYPDNRILFFHSLR